MNFGFSKHGERSLEKLDSSMVRRVLKKLEYWEKTGHPLRYAKKLEGAETLFKYRLGPYPRIIVKAKPEEHLLVILEIDSRDHVYDDLQKFL